MVKIMLMFVALFLFATSQDLCAYSTVYPTGKTIYEAEKTDGGYTLYCSEIEGHDRSIIMVDMLGEIVNVWHIKGFRLGPNAQPLPNGNLLCHMVLGTADKALVELDWNSNIEWSFHDPVHHQFHHDFQRLESGNTLVLCREITVVPEISDETISDDYIIEIDPQGQLVWEWHTYDHFLEFGFDQEARTLIYQKGGDWAHTNSIQSFPDNLTANWIFQEGNILVSQRQTNIVFVIEKRTNNIIWKLKLNDNVPIVGQHQARLIKKGLPGERRIILFDNGGKGGYPLECRLFSRVLEIDPLSGNITWEYNGASSGQNHFCFFSPFKSGAERLPNGNTLICEGNTGRIFEIIRDGEIVWEYINPFFHNELGSSVSGFTNEVYRAWRVTTEWVEISRRRGR